MRALLLLSLLAAAPARAAIITGSDYGGANLVPANGDFLTGTFTNVGLFDVGTGTTATVIQGLPLAVYATTISIRGILQGTGRGASGGGGGAVSGSGQNGTAADSGGLGGGTGGASAATPKGGSGGGGAGAGGTGAGSSAGPAGVGYGSTGTVTSPISADDLFMGSGGGGGAGNSSLQGGGGANGGAAIYLEAASMTVTGSLLVSADTATAVTDSAVGAHPAGGGGGGGGTLLLRIPGILNLYGATLSANGGGGGSVDSLFAGTLDPGGGGGGGRIKMFTGSRSIITVSISTAAGPAGFKDGAFSGSTDTAAPGLSSGTIGAASFGVVAASPTAFGFSSVYVTSISWTWSNAVSTGDAPTGSDKFRLYPGTSTPPFPLPQVIAAALTTGATETGLTPNTTYSRFLTAFTDWGDSLPSTIVSTFTLASVPGAASPAFTAMADVSLTVNWTAGASANPSYTNYEVDRATSAVFAVPASTSFVVGLSSSPTGLTPNTSYYFRVRAINLAQIPTAFAATLTTATLASLPTGAGFSGVNVTSVVFTWSGGANPSDTLYIAEISTDNFFSVNASSQTLNASVAFTGLVPGTLYYFHVAARNRNGVSTANTTAVSAKPGILTDLTPPTAPGVPAADRTFSSDGKANYAWAAAASSVGILDYNFQLGTSLGASDFFNGSTTTLAFAAAGLVSGKTYYAQVRARSNAGVFGPFSAVLVGLPVFIPGQQSTVAKPYNWPNPFNPAVEPAQITFFLEAPGTVTLGIFTLQGKKVKELSQTFVAGGNQIMVWDGTNEGGQKVPSGGYVVSIKKSSGAAQKFKIAVKY